jgi:hypothetical protein
MDALTVDIALLKALETPELKLAPGRAVMARVVVQEAGRGQITIAGAKLDAQLPTNVRAGDELRLTVKEVTSDRVVLSMSQLSTATGAERGAPTLPAGEAHESAQAQQSLQEIPFAAVASAPDLRSDELDSSDPDGGSAGAHEETHVLSLRYPAPNLGPVDLRFELTEGTIRVTVGLAQGEPFEAAQAASDELRENVGDASARAASVLVVPRREPLEIYA